MGKLVVLPQTIQGASICQPSQIQANIKPLAETTQGGQPLLAGHKLTTKEIPGEQMAGSRHHMIYQSLPVEG